MNWLAFVLFFFMMPFALAKTTPIYPFADKNQQQQFNQVIHELRCLVCQNEDLADSNANLAKDLRVQIYKMILQGKTNPVIKKYLRNRYGDFILFKPAVNRQTYLLWFAPFILLLIGLLFIINLCAGRKFEKCLYLSFLRKQKSKKNID